MKAFRDFLRAAFFWVADRIVVIGRRATGAGVVVVRLDAIGDFVLWLDCARRLREHYPGQRITLVANARWAETARNLPYWDEVWPVTLGTLGSMRHPAGRWRLLRKLRRQGFDRAIQPVYSRTFLGGDSMIRATGAAVRIGSAGDCSNILPRWKKVADRWYTRLLPVAESPMTELERGAEFMRALGIADYLPRVASVPVMARLREGLRLEQPYFIVFPGALHDGKRWPIDRFVGLIEQLHARTGWVPVVCGGPDEIGLCGDVAQRASTRVVNLAGETSLVELTEVMRAARLLVGNDSAAVHIAAAVATQSVCILGGGHFGRFLPYAASVAGLAPAVVHRQMPCFNCNWQCTQPHAPGGAYPCISSIPMEAVVEASLREIQLAAAGQPVNLTIGSSEK